MERGIVWPNQSRSRAMNPLRSSVRIIWLTEGADTREVLLDVPLRGRDTATGTSSLWFSRIDDIRAELGSFSVITYEGPPESRVPWSPSRPTRAREPR